MSKMPTDDGGVEIPVLGLTKHGGYIVPFTSSTANSSPQISGTKVASLHATVDCFVEITVDNAAANTSNSHFLPASSMVDISLGQGVSTANYSKYISVIGATEAGTLYISKRD